VRATISNENRLEKSERGRGCKKDGTDHPPCCEPLSEIFPFFRDQSYRELKKTKEGERDHRGETDPYPNAGGERTNCSARIKKRR